MNILESFELLFKYLFELYILTKTLHGCLDGIETVLEYVRSGEFLFDSPTYLKVDVLANLFVFFHTYAYYSHCYNNHCLK